LQNILYFCFWVMEYEKFPLSIQRKDNKWNIDITRLQLKIVSGSQWTLA